MIIAKFSTDKQIQLLQFYSWKHMYYRHTHKKIVMIKNVSIPIWLPHYLLIDFSGCAYGIDKSCHDLKREDLLVSSCVKWLNRAVLPWMLWHTDKQESEQWTVLSPLQTGKQCVISAKIWLLTPMSLGGIAWWMLLRHRCLPKSLECILVMV